MSDHKDTKKEFKFHRDEVFIPYTPNITRTIADAYITISRHYYWNDDGESGFYAITEVALVDSKCNALVTGSFEYPADTLDALFPPPPLSELSPFERSFRFSSTPISIGPVTVVYDRSKYRWKLAPKA